ncbi:MAG: PAS domain S-box protein, partial [Cyclobacteriaceae bacterium]|nr:PAS domain S-box protein [Cyclobacteriaceae bacterium]
MFSQSPHKSYSLVLLFTLLGGLSVISLFNYNLFHSLAESFSLIILTGIFFISWHSREYNKDPFFTSLGIGFLFVGFLNLIHIFNYNNLIIHGRHVAQWMALQYFLTFILLVTPYFKLIKHFRYSYLFIIYSIIVSLLLLSIYYWDNFPVCYNYETKVLTPFKKVSEYIIGALLLVSIIPHLKNRAEPPIFYNFLLGTLCLVLSGFSFTLYSEISGLFNAIGHILRIISFFLFYRSFIEITIKKPYSFIFRELSTKQKLLEEANRDLEKNIEERTMILQKTNRHLEEEIIRYTQAENRFRNLFDTYTQGIIIADHRGKIVMANEVATTIFGYDHSDLIGESIEVLIPRHLATTHEKMRGKYFEHPTKREMGIGLELAGRKRDGSVFPVEISLSPWEEDGQHFVTAIIQDITTRKKIEDTLRKNNFDLKKKNSELDNFIYSISHYIRA